MHPQRRGGHGLRRFGATERVSEGEIILATAVPPAPSSARKPLSGDARPQPAGGGLPEVGRSLRLLPLMPRRRSGSGAPIAAADRTLAAADASAYERR